MASKEMQELAKKMLATRQGTKKKPLASKKALKTAPPAKKAIKATKKAIPATKTLPKKSKKTAMKESSKAALPLVDKADKALMTEVEKYSPKKKVPSPKAPVDKFAARRTALMSEMASEDAFKVLERDLPKGGKALKVAKKMEDGAENVAGAALKKKSVLKSVAKGAGVLGAAAGLIYGLSGDDPASALDPANSEMAGNKDIEDMEVAESNQRQKTSAKLAADKAMASDKVTKIAAAPRKSVSAKKAPKFQALPSQPKGPTPRVNGKTFSAQEEGPMDGMFDTPIAQTPGGVVIRNKSDEQKEAEFHDHLKRNFGAPEGDDGELEKLVRDTTLDELDKAGMKRTSPRLKVKKPVVLKTGKSFSQIHQESQEDDEY